MENEVRIESRPWEPQDLIDDLQLMIDEEPDNYLNSNRTTLCMARDYLKKFFAEETLRPKGRWELHGNDDDCGCSYFCSNCHRSYPEEWFWDHGQYVPFENCPHCTAKMEG